MTTDGYRHQKLQQPHLHIHQHHMYEPCLSSCDCEHVGNWALVVKRDYFNKVAGGVRKQEKLDAHAELVKIRFALYPFLVMPSPCCTHILLRAITCAGPSLVTGCTCSVAVGQAVVDCSVYVLAYVVLHAMCLCPTFRSPNPKQSHSHLLCC